MSICGVFVQIKDPVVCGVSPLGMDHMETLGALSTSYTVISSIPFASATNLISHVLFYFLFSFLMCLCVSVYDTVVN